MYLALRYLSFPSSNKINSTITCSSFSANRLRGIYASNHLTLENHHTTNNGCFRHFSNAFRPIRIECLEVPAATFNDQLLERGFIGVF